MEGGGEGGGGGRRGYWGSEGGRRAGRRRGCKREVVITVVLRSAAPQSTEFVVTRGTPASDELLTAAQVNDRERGRWEKKGGVVAEGQRTMKGWEGRARDSKGVEGDGT